MTALSNAEHAVIAEAIGASGVKTTERLPLGQIVDFATLDMLGADASVEQIELALVRVRESLPVDADRLTRETLRATIRERYPRVPTLDDRRGRSPASPEHRDHDLSHARCRAGPARYHADR